MRHHILTSGLAILLLMMGLSVILILSGSGTVGLILGLVVAGTASLLLMSMLLYELVNSRDRYRSREDRGYQRPYATGF